MSGLPPGAIPADQFQAATLDTSAAPAGGIPVDQFESQEDTFGTPKQQAIAGIEGIARGVAGPAATYLESKGLHIPRSEILAREEANPVTSGVGEGAGLVGGMLTGTGEASLLEHAGQGATKLAGLSAEAPSLMARIGSSAVKQATEMALYQGGDETHKMFLNDPNTSAESAIGNVGLAGALGGAGGAFVTGAVSPLWKATIGKGIDSALGMLSARMGGIEGAEASDVIARSGLNINDSLKAVMGGEDTTNNLASKLRQTDTTVAGRMYQGLESDLRQQAGGAVLQELGVNPEALQSVPEYDKFSIGTNLGQTLKEDLEPKIKEIADQYESTEKRFQDLPFTQAQKQLTAEKISQQIIEQGWNKADTDSNVKLASKIIEDLQKQDNAKDLKKYITNLYDNHPFGKDTYSAVRRIVPILRDAQASAIVGGIEKMGGSSATELAAYRNLNQGYSKVMNDLETLNEHLHIGRFSSPKEFLNLLQDKTSVAPEDLVNRLSGKNKAQVLAQLQTMSPRTLEAVKQMHVNELVSKAIAKAQPGSEMNVHNLISEYNKLNPQVKSLVTSSKGADRISAIDDVLSRLKDPTHNFSNTARTIMKHTAATPSPISMVAALTGHAQAGLLSHFGKLGFAEGHDALRLGMLKFLGSSRPIEPGAFKSAVQYISNMTKSQSVIQKAAKSLFKGGTMVVSSKNAPLAADREKLAKAVEKYQDNPEGLANMFNSRDNTGHYMPEHQTALAQNVTGQLNYLQQLRPQPYKPGPLDASIQPGPGTTARYERALDIANNPVSILNHVKHGTLQTTDLQDINALYPSLYQNMIQHVSSELANAQADGATIPYKTKLGLSLFMAQPIDSTMTPASIMAAQPPPQPMQQPNQPMKGRNGKSAVNKLANSYKTSSQSAEEDRSSRS